MSKPDKPLKARAYGSIPHLPGSKRGTGDHGVNDGQAAICTTKSRPGDTIIVQQKVDGSCTSVARIDGELMALQRKGYPARTSPFKQHHLFADWVDENRGLFAGLNEGERLVGEWIAQAHGTIYPAESFGTPWVVFDLMRDAERATHGELQGRFGLAFDGPTTIHIGPPVSVEEAMRQLGVWWHESQIEGIVYRVEREGRVDFLAKWVKPDYVPGRYLPEVSGEPEVWNWRPE